MRLSEILTEAVTGGDCYEAAAKYMMDEAIMSNKSPNIILVHAEVTGQGPLEGVKYGHAWIEDGDTVIEVANGNFLKIPKQVYYKTGNVNTKKMFRYDKEKTLKKLSQSHHYGPWDLKTER